MSKCGCTCVCHTDEALASWPGPCIVCCEPGMDCNCGRALARLLYIEHRDTDIHTGDTYIDGCPTCEGVEGYVPTPMA